MILLDTNVISEWMKPAPDPRVLDWLDAQPAGGLFISAIAKAEIEAGIALLPEGKRRTALHRAAEVVFDELSGRCLALDCDAAAEYARILTLCRRAGRPISVEDAQIAAIARRHSMNLATRNTTDFDCVSDLQLIDPWKTGISR
jgi:predicted nucleic acid-binding protein